MRRHFVGFVDDRPMETRAEATKRIIEVVQNEFDRPGATAASISAVVEKAGYRVRGELEGKPHIGVGGELWGGESAELRLTVAGDGKFPDIRISVRKTRRSR